MTAKEMIPAAPQLSLSGSDMEAFVVRGDLSVLSPKAKADHYLFVCRQLGLDASTKPFEYIKLNGKEVLYATKGCAEQLRKIHAVAISIVARERSDDIYAVTARATLATGRTDESLGAVSIAGLKGENLANALMKAETKAKRRVTLSLLGLNMLDELEVETIVGAGFANLPTERPVSIVSAEAPKSNLPPAAPHAPTEVPSWLVASRKPITHLGGRLIAELPLEDLELLHEDCTKSAQRTSGNDDRSRVWRGWFNALASMAAFRMDQINGIAPDVGEEG